VVGSSDADARAAPPSAPLFASGVAPAAELDAASTGGEPLEVQVEHESRELGQK